MNGRRARRLGRRARARRDRRQLAPSRTPETERAHPRAARARPLRRHALHDGAARASPAIPRRCSPARAASSRRRSATGRPSRRSSRARADSRATRGSDAYAELRERLDAARRSASAAPTACSSTRTSTSTARPPRAAGVGFYGKNTMLITRRHGSWVVLGTLVTDVELEPSPPLDARLRLVHALHRGLPDRRARRAGGARRDQVPLVLDAGAGADSRALSRRARREVYGCDICQDVCPWNRGVEKRRAGEPLPAGAEPHVSLVDWLEADAAELRSPLPAPLRAAPRRPLPPAKRARRARQNWATS